MAGLACAPDPPQGALLVLLDTLRADRTSLHGHDRPTTPNLERLAEAGVVFERAHSTSPWTLPAMAGIMSGRLPASDLFLDGVLQESLVGELARAGFATGGVTEGGYVSRHYGFDLGFTSWSERLVDTLEVKLGGRIEDTVDESLRWLAEHRAERFFLLVHTYEPHMPYTRRLFTGGLRSGGLGDAFELADLIRIRAGRLRLEAVQREYLAALYDGGVAKADQELGRLLEGIAELGLAETTLVVVTSDHGEDLGARDWRRAGFHGHSVYGELLHVPLVVVDPTRDFPVARVTAPVRSLDVMPTVLDLLGVHAPDGREGRSLLPLLEGGEDAGRSVVAVGSRRGQRRRVAVMEGPLKLIGDAEASAEDEPLELYDLSADPGELRNLAPERPELVARLRPELDDLRGRLEQRGGDDVEPVAKEQTRDALRALGYLEE